MSRPLLVILGNQLFPLEHLPPPEAVIVFMAEDMGLCTYEKHHQQKIVLFLAAMRSYADSLRAAGYTVEYRQLEPGSKASYEHRLLETARAADCSEIWHFEVEDKPMEARLAEFAAARGLDRIELPSPMFLCTRTEFHDYARGRSQLLMADFYKQQRRKLGVLLDESGRPLGGKWSFDADNRKKLPRNVEPPAITWAGKNGHVDAVIELTTATFGEHPGNAADFCWPTTREQALEWLDDFVASRLDSFGPYEDAISMRSTTVFHSLLSPMLNLGLLTPAEVVAAVIARQDSAPLASVEGFVRQVIGWREFVRGVYQEYSEVQESRNFWSHERELTDAWYTGATGLPPLDDAITTAQELGWTHHIPRLMVLGNLMTLCEIRPSSAHRWFMEMFVDSSEWVMGPNVYGMALFSDGGIFATKPYICGSNYLRKMSDYPKGAWCDVVDGLYWRFIDKHRQFFSSNPRLALMPKALDRLKADRRSRIVAAAEKFLDSYTT